MISSQRDWLRRMLTESEKVAIEPEVWRWEAVMVRVRNVAQDWKPMWRWTGKSLALVKPMFSNKKENKNKNK